MAEQEYPQVRPWDKHRWMSLTPLVVFLLMYLVTSILLNDF
jgi:hypothetical protein